MSSSPAIANRLILMALNIQIELNDPRFSRSYSKEIRQQTDVSLVASSFSNPLIEELILCVKYYCNELIELINQSRSCLSAATSFLDDLMVNAKICLSIFDQYHDERSSHVQSLLSSPFREDAWHLISDIDLNLFVKCRIILVRLRSSALLLYQCLKNDEIEEMNDRSSTKKKRIHSSRSVASFIQDRKK